MHKQKMNQPGSELGFSEVFAYIPWCHHALIIKKTIDDGWSRKSDSFHVCMLISHIKGRHII